MKVAVTGAGGFVGGHVLRALEQVDGCEVVAVVRPATKDIRLTPNAREMRFDLGDTTDDVFDRLGRPDVLIHLAWGGLPNYMSLHHFEDELPAQYRFLSTMVAGGLGAALVTGTCFEYGMANGALTEDMTPAPANPYSFAKVALLRQLEFLQAKIPFALTWARLFYMWGPGQAPTSIYPLLAAAAARNDAVFPMSGASSCATISRSRKWRACLSRWRFGARMQGWSTSVRVGRSRCERWSSGGSRSKAGR
ncbi:NAD(P)-dependent oxidoreductase [Sphingomonas sp. 7/4-4]|uniref:NAD-dependent epimerase/dehydratase family protein n=1 Tax=Sphingomonas sp. 7/4-4 TaxID=3018446 RepID=UPI0022F3AB6B|nr:NAD(P)-dependent oxidoreductase [Sphingomonas sp. 7/4-4]WBY07960.1 NAD(P)-dependent oxidoreductase [Sphingomonas sp. 7/4-4]